MSKNGEKSLLDEINDKRSMDLVQFNKATPRKMTIHILSDKRKDGISLVEFLTNTKFPYSNELNEVDIKPKINLYSFINYKVYEKTSKMMNSIIKKGNLDQKGEAKNSFSEVIIIIDNENIYHQIDEIRDIINSNDDDSDDDDSDDDNNILSQNYYIPFILIISPRELNLKGFPILKTFQYKIYLYEIIELKNNNQKEKKEETFQFFKKINVLFSYYNELGDEFTFVNSNGTVITIKTENSNFPINMNILLLGKSGAGKSTLLNQILGEKKSLEGGGTGFSTTSKNIQIFRKEGVPIRIYDAKGIEDEDSKKNYMKILNEFNGILKKSNDSLNAIFFLIKYNTATVIEKIYLDIFEKLIDYNVPILFIITKTPYDNTKKSAEKKKRKKRESDKNKIENAIEKAIKDAFANKNRGNESKDFINDFVKIFFVNLVKDDSIDNPVPVFGINEVLSFFNKLVPQQNWEVLLESCLKKDVDKYKEYSKKNIFLKSYSEFDLIKEKNKKEALDYLYYLKLGAGFTGLIPGVDFGMEYYYRQLFKEKLKFLYGFDYDQAELVLQKDSKYKSNDIKNDYLHSEETTHLFSSKQSKGDIRNEIIDNTDKLEQNIENQIDKKITNKKRNTTSIVRGVLTAVGGIGSRFVVSTGLKVINSMFLPASLIFAAYSSYNIDNDCKKIIEIFEEAFTPLRFQTLNSYVNSFQNAIAYLDFMGKKIIEEANKEDEN